MKKLTLLAMVTAVALSGCAAKELSVLQKTYTLELAQQSKEYVAVDAYAPAGLITRTVVIYNDQGKQEYADTQSVGGPLNDFFDQGFSGMAIGAGIGSGLTAQGAANYSGGNASAAGGSANAAATGGNANAGAAAVSSSNSAAFSNSISSAKATGGWTPPGQGK